MPPVTFDPIKFRERFPKFANETKYPDGQLLAAFQAAEVYVDNTDSATTPYDPDKQIFIREIMLYTLVCHLLTLQDWTMNGQAGPLTNASEGSVTAGFASPHYLGNGRDFYMQTPCGQAFWQMSLPYRLGGRYRPVFHFHPWG